MDKKIKAYKGFDKDLKCKGFQYEIGKEYKHDGEVKPCKSGFHACKFPLDVFSYYPPSNNNRFAEIEASGDIKKETDKICASHISIKAEISLNVMIESSVKIIFDGLKGEKVEDSNKRAKRSLATNTGNYSAATNTGDYSAATNTGDYSAATNTGDQSAATNTGYQSAATNTGNYSAATNTGNQSAATNTGDYSAATVGDRDSIAICTGYKSKAKASKGSWIVLTERNHNMKILNIKSAQPGVTKGVKPDTFYILKDNKFVEAE